MMAARVHKHKVGNREVEELSIWNQTACRSYMRRALYFPLAKDARPKFIAHMQAALDRLAVARTDLAGELEVSCPERHGRVLLSKPESTEAKILFECTEDHICTTFGDTYGSIKEQGFPQAIFVYRGHWINNGDFTTPNATTKRGRRTRAKPLPVTKVLANFIDGGLVLVVFLHHSFADGNGMGLLLECLAHQTRCPTEEIKLPHCRLFPPGVYDNPSDEIQEHARTAKRLATVLEEYQVLPNCSGPSVVRMKNSGMHLNEIETHPTIFVFNVKKLKELGNTVQQSGGLAKPPSVFTCLASLTWAHCTAARLAQEADLRPDTDLEKPAELTITTNWKSRVKADMSAYFGNATISPRASLSLENLVDACKNETTLAEVANVIQNTLDAVDVDYISKRTEFFRALPDPRMVTQNRDPRSPRVMFTNSWRWIAGDTEWDLEGDGHLVKPDAIRRAEPESSISTMCLMPSRKDSQVVELLVELSRVSMKALQADEDWMRWVERVVQTKLP